MNKERTEVVMEEDQACNFCPQVAAYDGRTVYGSWAYMCEDCYKIYGIGLGIGKGQKLVKKR